MKTGEKERSLRNHEVALVKLGGLYRDQKCVFLSFLPLQYNSMGPIDRHRNAQGLAEVITLSLAFMSSTAKGKTAKLGPSPLLILLR